MFGHSRMILFLAGALAVGLGLAGCSGSTTGQSTTDACRSLESSMTAVTAGLNATFSNLATNPTAATAKLQEVSDSFTRSLTKISNPAVRRAGETADKSLAALTLAVKKALAEPKSADQAVLEDAANQVEKDFTAVGKACA